MKPMKAFSIFFLLVGVALSSCAVPLGLIPPEVAFRKGYLVKSVPPEGWTSGVAWFQALHNELLGPKTSQIEIKDIRFEAMLDDGSVRMLAGTYTGWDSKKFGGLYLRNPWYYKDTHTDMPAEFSDGILRYRPDLQPDRVWHHWTNPRSVVPEHTRYVVLTATIRLTGAAIFQMGVDWWRSFDSSWAGLNVNNTESGCSDWFFPTGAWQTVRFSTRK